MIFIRLFVRMLEPSVVVVTDICHCMPRKFGIYGSIHLAVTVLLTSKIYIVPPSPGTLFQEGFFLQVTTHMHPLHLFWQMVEHHLIGFYLEKRHDLAGLDSNSNRFALLCQTLGR